MMARGHHRPLCPPRGALRLTPNECARGILGKPKHSVVRRTKSRLARRLCRLAQRKQKKPHQQRKLLQASVSRNPIKQTLLQAPVSRQQHQPPKQEKAFMLPVSRQTNHHQIHKKTHILNLTPNTASTTNLTITSKSTSPFIATSSPTTQKKSAGVSPRKESRLGALPLGGSSWVVGVKPRWVHRRGLR